MNPMNEKKPGDQLLQEDVSAKRTEELSAYEMTEVRIKLEGKFSSFSEEDMNGAGRNVDVREVNLALQKSDAPLLPETEKLDLPEMPGENWENRKIRTADIEKTAAAEAVVLPVKTGKLSALPQETAGMAEEMQKVQIPDASLQYESAAVQVEKSAAVLPETKKAWDKTPVQSNTEPMTTEEQKTEIPALRKIPAMDITTENNAEIHISLPHIDKVQMKLTGTEENGAAPEPAVLPESRTMPTCRIAKPTTDAEALRNAAGTEKRTPENGSAGWFTAADLREFVKGAALFLTEEEQKAVLQSMGSLPEIRMPETEPVSVEAAVPDSPLTKAAPKPAIADLGNGPDVSAMRVDAIPSADPIVKKILELAKSASAPVGLSYEEMCRRCAVPEMKLEYNTAIGKIMTMLDADKRSGDLTVQ